MNIRIKEEGPSKEGQNEVTGPPDHVAHLIEILITAAPSVNGEITPRIGQLCPWFKLAEPMAAVCRFNRGPTVLREIVRGTVAGPRLVNSLESRLDPTIVRTRLTMPSLPLRSGSPLRMDRSKTRARARSAREFYEDPTVPEWEIATRRRRRRRRLRTVDRGK